MSTSPLDGGDLPGQEYVEDFSFPAQFTQQMDSSPPTVQGLIAGQTNATDITPVDGGSAQTKLWNLAQIHAQLDAIVLTFPAKTNIEFPRVLAQMLATWSLNTGTGAYSESGTGAFAGASASLSLSAQGRGQGSASALGDITPIFAPKPTYLPVLDYFFFLPNPVTLSAILTRATAIATALAGTATVVNDWPIFAPQVHSFFVLSSKVSVSCEQAARCNTSYSLVGGGSAAISSSFGTGTNEDFGPNVKVITFPECIHAAMGFTGPTMVQQPSSASALAYLAPGTNWTGAGTDVPTTLATAANGSITPTFIGPTPVPGLPNSGLYLYQPDVAVYKWGYSTVRARVFDFSIIAYPQVSLSDYSQIIGSQFVTRAAGNGYVLPILVGGAVGVWFNTGTETQPDFSAYGVTSYVQVTISPTSSSASIASATVAAFSGSPDWTAAIFSASATATQFTALQNGLAPFAFDVNSGAIISVLTPG